MKALPPILTAVVIVLLVIGGYVAAYLNMGERQALFGVRGTTFVKESIEVCYIDHHWLVTVFRPAAWVESSLRGIPVNLYSYSVDLQILGSEDGGGPGRRTGPMTP